jgi:hypothetical protein
VSKPEKIVEDELAEGVEARGGWCAKMIDSGRRGAPDRECRFPEGQLIYVETKAPMGQLRIAQIRYRERLIGLGFTVLVLYTIGQVQKFFSDYDRGVYG